MWLYPAERWSGADSRGDSASREWGGSCGRKRPRLLGKVPASLFNNVRQDKGQTRGTSATVIRKIKTVRRAPTFRKSANR
jgi:hypothetical protein